MEGLQEPGKHCPLCPRLVAFRNSNRELEPSWHNSPVPSFGGEGAELLIVGLAPGLHGANRTGRPFTGDAAGLLLYPTLLELGWASGGYSEDPGDGLQLENCRITNAVRCVPPQNRPTGAEIRNCQRFLVSELGFLQSVKAVVALGTVAHGAILTALGQRKSAHPFKHGEIYQLPGGLLLADSYHCSRYNVNTGRLTEEMFRAVFATVKARISA